MAFQRSGSGPPLVLLHGTTADHSTTWGLINRAFEQRFTVIAVDRRGRGASGDGPAYSLGREAEDVASVVDFLDEQADVVGHSFGALCALEGALLATGVRRLVLYEGVPLRGAGNYPSGIIERLAAMLERDEAENALVTMLNEVAGMPMKDVERLRAQADRWQRRIANIRSAPREMQAERDYQFQPDRFRELHIPVMLLVGGESPERELRYARGVADALPDARVVILPGQGHIAMHTAPELFTHEITRFLS